MLSAVAMEELVVPERPGLSQEEYEAWGYAWLDAKIDGAADDIAAHRADDELARRRRWRDREAQTPLIGIDAA